MQRNTGEIPILDNLRAIAAWSVCLYHFICTTTGLLAPASAVYKLFYFGQYGVHLFFIISGMVIPWSLYRNRYRISNFFRFLLKRIIRLEPPYLFSIFLVLLVIFLRKYSPTYDGVDREVNARQIFLHLGYLVPFCKDVTWLNNVYWTLAIEFQYYLAVGLLYFLFVSPVLWVRIVGYLVLLGAPFLQSSSAFLPAWLPLFGVGIALFLHKSGVIGVIEFALASLAFVVHLAFFHSPVVAVLASASAFVILAFFNRSNKVLAFLGHSSYSVYLIHPVLGATFVNVLSHYVSGSFAKFMLVLGGVVITFAGSYMMYLFIEKPSRRLSSRIQYQNK